MCNGRFYFAYWSSTGFGELCNEGPGWKSTQVWGEDGSGLTWAVCQRVPNLEHPPRWCSVNVRHAQESARLTLRETRARCRFLVSFYFLVEINWWRRGELNPRPR